MMFIHEWVLASPEYARLGSSWSVAHLFGEANFMADAASRGLFRALAQMARQTNVSLSRVDVPIDLQDLIQIVLDRPA